MLIRISWRKNSSKLPEKLSKKNRNASPPTIRKASRIPRKFTNRFPSCRIRAMLEIQSSIEKTRMNGPERIIYTRGDVSSCRTRSRPPSSSRFGPVSISTEIYRVRIKADSR